MESQVTSSSCSETFKFLFGSKLEEILPRRYMEASKIIDKPQITYSTCLEDGYLIKVIPFLLQRIKMWGVHHLNQSELASLISQIANDHNDSTSGINDSPKPTTSRAGLKRVKNPLREINNSNLVGSRDKPPLSRFDLLTCLYASCNPTVFQEIMRIISMFPVALPFIVQNILQRENEPKYICLFPLLCLPTYKWKQPNTDTVFQNHLFQSPFKMVLAVGSGKANVIGKSSILNQLFRDRNTFACRNDPGAELGKPLTLMGAVEMVVLNEDICSPSLWNEVVKPHYDYNKDEILLLANLHGDCQTLASTLEIIRPFVASIAVFVTPMEITAFDDFVEFVESMFGNSFADSIFYIFVDAPDDIRLEFPENAHIETQVLTQDSTLSKVRNILKDAVAVANSQKAPKIKTLPTTIDTDLIQFAKKVETKESNIFLDIISKQSCQSTKSLLRLQKLSLNYDQNVSNNIIQNQDWKMMISSLASILKLSEMDRIAGMTHIDRDISQRCAAESHSIRVKIMGLNQELQKAVDVQGCSTIIEENIRNRINQTYEELDSMTLGMEHFYRELAKLYSICLSQDNIDVDLKNTLKSLPDKVAELLINGHTIEVLDGDALQIQQSWFNAICHSICVRYPDLKIFVLSIIGLQSSGKSTLLNALFSCKFAVSVGRCTRGLFMRLVFLDKSLAIDLGVDAIIILDTEGLGAPEKLNDPETEFKDRQLATFTMSVSHMTLINILGESMADLTDIIQIVVVAMARLEKAEVSPDIMMIQHVQETDVSKCAAAAKAFCTAIQLAITTAEKGDMDLGVRNCKSLERFQQRIKGGGILKQFPSFKNGAAVSSPPSTQYHDSVVSLYTNILDACKQLKLPQQLHLWHDLIGNVWEAVSKQDFALRFKNIKDIQEFIERGKITAKVKEAIDDALYFHKNEIEVKIRNKLQGNQVAEETLNHEELKTEIQNIINTRIPIEPAACKTNCDACVNAEEKKKNLYELVKSKSIEEETKNTVAKYMENNRTKAITDLLQLTETFFMKKCMTTDIDSIIEELLKTRKSRNTEVGIEDLTNEIWSEVVKLVSAKVKVQPVRTLIREEILHNYQNNDHVKQKFFNLSRFSVHLREYNGVDSPGKLYGRNIKKLDAVTARHLEDEIRMLPNVLLESKKSDRFLDGMVSNFKELITKSISEFYVAHLKNQDKMFLPDFKSEIHAYALYQFILVMEEKQKTWDANNNPMEYLKLKKAEYRQEISTRIKHGFGFQGEGSIIGQKFYESILKRGKTAGDMEHLQHMRNTSWLLSYENIMLECYLNLQNEVNNGRKENAVNFFYSQTTSIEAWFNSKVRSISTEKGNQECRKTIASELNRVKQKISNSQSIQAVVDFVKEYIASVNDVDYKYMCDTPPEKASQHQFQMMRQAVEETLKTKENELLEYSKLSEYPFTEIRKRLGCNASCPVCGTLCLGESNHHLDSGRTKLHHTCHSPSGLTGTNYFKVNSLAPEICSEYEDTRIFRWRNCAEGMIWSQAKTHDDYKHWLYMSHNKSQFLKLMKWFFLQLHEDLAKKYNVQPCTTEHLQRYGYHQLPSIHDIVAELKVAVGSE